jgi:hypothetical protein
MIFLFIGVVVGFIINFWINLFAWMKSEKAHEEELWRYRIKLVQLMRDAHKFGLDVPALKQYENSLIEMMDAQDFDISFLEEKKENHKK